MAFDWILFVGSAAMSIATVRDLSDWGYRPNVTFVRYADDDMTSPSCSDWIVPGAIDVRYE